MNKISTRQTLEAIRNGDRIALSQAITLIESQKLEHQKQASQLIQDCLPFTGSGLRLGITGVPGVGKSTFIDGFGKFLTGHGHKLAILSIDPSSMRNKGSILGDKTRMDELAQDPNAYIRPSPSGSSLGGVAQGTREAIYLCEAAGFDIILIETVGVGQSETTIKGMVDFFMLLMQAGGGDELQGIKRGIMEMADMLVVNKADTNAKEVAHTIQEYKRALHLFPPHPDGWTVPVLQSSALRRTGFEEIWEKIRAFKTLTESNGSHGKTRQDQNLLWFREALSRKLEHDFFAKPNMKEDIILMEKSISENKISPRQAVERLTQQKRTH